ncbi:MAG: hypothetical protein ABIN20_02390 [candidate division WOR-3 bacterium]
MILAMVYEEEFKKIEPYFVLEGYEIINLEDFGDLGKFNPSDVKCFILDPGKIGEKIFSLNISEYDFPFVVIVTKANKNLKEKLKGFSIFLELENNSFSLQEQIENLLSRI